VEFGLGRLTEDDGLDQLAGIDIFVQMKVDYSCRWTRRGCIVPRAEFLRPASA
jgi:hypothetical protein